MSAVKADRVLTPAQQARSDKAKAAWAARKAAQAAAAPAPEKPQAFTPESAGQPVIAEEAPALPSSKAPAGTTPKKVIHIHFLEDGGTVAGKVWYKGEELRAEEGSDMWPLVTDKNGDSIFTLDEDEQYDKYGKQIYGQGPWPGRGFDLKRTKHPGDLVDAETKQPIIDLLPHEIAQLEAANKMRGVSS